MTDLEEALDVVLQKIMSVKKYSEFDMEVRRLADAGMEQFRSLTIGAWEDDGMPEIHDGYLDNILKVVHNHDDVREWSKAISVSRQDTLDRVYKSGGLEMRLWRLWPPRRAVIDHNITHLLNALQMLMVYRYKQNLMERYEINDMPSAQEARKRK